MPFDELTEDLDVLVVDDEPAVRELLVEYFSGLGFRVSSAEDGRGAIALLQRAWGRYGLVITDLNLPGADGFAVLQAARQTNPTCVVVIITGYASLDSAIRAVRVGAYDYLTKPFSLAQLDIILSRIRDRRPQRPAPPVAPAESQASLSPRPLPEAKADPAGDGVPVPVAAGTVPIDRVIVTSEVVAPAGGYPGMTSYNVAQRLGLLEAAFGRIEALLREKR